jgi:hypothetical protein
MAIILLDKTAPAAAEGTKTTASVSCGDRANGARGSVLLQARMIYGSGGTTFTAYVQATADNGLTWNDVARFDFVTANKTRLFNLRTSTAVTSAVTPSDGGIVSADSCVDGIVGDALRVKYAATGTYDANTRVIITAVLR